MKPELPSLDGDLQPRRLNLRAIQPGPVSDEAVTMNSRQIGGQWGAQTSLEVRPKTPIASLRIEIPEYLDHALAMKAAADRVTKQYLVLRALSAAGFKVEAQDMVEDKRKKK